MFHKKKNQALNDSDTTKKLLCLKIFVIVPLVNSVVLLYSDTTVDYVLPSSQTMQLM